jgi:hypothetical protein
VSQLVHLLDLQNKNKNLKTTKLKILKTNLLCALPLVALALGGAALQIIQIELIVLA